MTFRRSVSVLALLVVSAGLSGCGAPHPNLSALVPTTWTMTAHSGHIASPCLGSWEECGSLKWTYETHASDTAAIRDVQARLNDAGWTISNIRGTAVSATHGKKSHSANFYVSVADGKASVIYVHE